MSSQVNTALYGVLSGNAALVAALGVDPRDNGPAIYAGVSLNEVAPADSMFPLIIYRACIVDPENQFPGTGHVDREFYDLEIWSRSRTANAIESIFDMVDPLLHLQRITSINDTHNYLWQTLRIPGGAPAHYDTKIKGWFGMWRYCFRHGRG